MGCENLTKKKIFFLAKFWRDFCLVTRGKMMSRRDLGIEGLRFFGGSKNII